MSYWKCEQCENINEKGWLSKPNCKKCGAKPGTTPKGDELLVLVIQNQEVLDKKLDLLRKTLDELSTVLGSLSDHDDEDDLPRGEILPEPVPHEEEPKKKGK